MTLIILSGFIVCCIIYIGLRLYLRRITSPTSEPQFILVGIDGGCWSIINPLIKEGKLPNIAKLMKTGSHGDLIPESPFSPPSWTTIATGMSSEKHGIYHFTRHVAGQYERSMTSSGMINGANIWELIEGAGKYVGVVGWLFPVQYPAKLLNKREKLLLASTMNFSWLLSKIYLKWLHLRRAPYLRICPVQQKTKADWQMAQALYYLKKKKPVFFAIRLYGTDAFQHLYWKYTYPDYYDVDTADAKRYGSMISDFYQKIDNFIGQLMKVRNRNFVIVSDHGFHGYSRQEKQPSWLLYDFDYNKLLNKLGILHYKDGSQSIDWGKTTIYSCGDPRAFHELAINLRGREPDGIVPNNEYDETMHLVKSLLEDIRFKDNGERLFGKITVHDGSPYGRYMNFDILGEEFRLWNNDCFDILIEEQFKCLFQDNNLLDREILINSRNYKLRDFITPSVWSATHSPKGIFISNGDYIKPDRIDSLSTMDIAPIILYWMGLPVPIAMEGKVNLQLFTEEFLRNNPVRMEANKTGFAREVTHQTQHEEERIKDELRNLGYF